MARTIASGKTVTESKDDAYFYPFDRRNDFKAMLQEA
jgi:hypothetical protein